MDRRGFTLIEVAIALTLLLVVMVGFVSTTGKTTHTAALSDRQEAAISLVNDRIDVIRSDPNYGGLDSTYSKTETTFPTLPGFQRVTGINQCRIRGNGQGKCTGLSTDDDYVIVTVTVSGPGLPAPVARSVAVAAP